MMKIASFPSRLSVVFLWSIIVGWFVSGSISVSNETGWFHWGDTFGAPMQSLNIDNSCVHNGRPVCCALVDPHISPYVYPHKQHDTQVQHSNIHYQHSSNNCEITKEYIPSPYEQRHIAKAKEIDKLPTEKERRHILTLFILEDFLHVPIWLERVKFHMTKPLNHSYHEHLLHPIKEDLEYLSRFQITQHCEENHNKNITWNEWIEPLTVHARHPYSFLHCMEIIKEVKRVNGTFLQYRDKLYPLTNNKNNVTIPKLNIMNSDYVLLQRLRHLPPHNNNNNSHVTPHHNRQKHVGNHHNNTTVVPPKRYFLDAGCSTFDSSLNWFLCAYLQNGIDFDLIYGWEATLLEPKDFWERVPPRLAPFIHFFNIPITVTNHTNTNITSHQHHHHHPATNVLQLIEEIGKEEDFIAFKLDVDTTSVEIPIVLEILHSHEVIHLIDEFFFELHFHCEYLMYCGWDKKNTPKEYDGLVLDRSHALLFFQTLRQQHGIRAHIWP